MHKGVMLKPSWTYAIRLSTSLYFRLVCIIMIFLTVVMSVRWGVDQTFTFKYQKIVYANPHLKLMSEFEEDAFMEFFSANIGPWSENLTDSERVVLSDILGTLKSITDINDLSEKLLEYLTHEDYFVRAQAAYSLIGLSSQTVVKPLIKALKDDNRDVRAYSAHALADYTYDLALEPLIEALLDEDSIVRLQAIHALVELYDERALDPMFELLKHDVDGKVRCYIAQEISKFPSLDVVTQLIRALKDDDERVRCSAAKSLGDYRFFPAIGTDAYEWAVTHKTGFKLEILEYGATLTEPWIEGLLTLLKDDNESVRYQAAESLGKNKDERIVKELIKLMIKEGEEEVVAACAAQSLGNIGNILAVEPLIMMVTTVEIDIFLENFLIALGKIGDKRAFHPLLKEMKDEDSEAREHAAVALGYLGDKRAVKSLIEAMRDEWDYELVSSAAYALGQLGDKRAVEPLIESLNHEWDDVRSRAVDALIVLGDERAGKPLIQMLNDNVEYIRGRSAVGLGKLGGNHAIKPLTLLLEDSSNWVRDMAEKAVDEIQDRITKKE